MSCALMFALYSATFSLSCGAAMSASTSRCMVRTHAPSSSQASAVPSRGIRCPVSGRSCTSRRPPAPRHISKQARSAQWRRALSRARDVLCVVRGTSCERGGGEGEEARQRWARAGGRWRRKGRRMEGDAYQQPPFPDEEERVKSDMARVGVPVELRWRDGSASSEGWT